MPMFDSSPAFTPGLCFWLPGPIRLQGTPPDADEVSRFSRVQFLDVRMALGLRRACRKLTLSLPPVWPSRWEHSVGARNSFSQLDSSPVDASVYASPGTSRHPAQDLRSRWFVTPFSWGSFIPNCTPVYPDDCAPSRSRLVTP